MDDIDFYRVLGVTPNTPVAEIRAAYRRLARLHHPDRGGSPEAMKRLNLAWEQLGNPERKAAYDQERQQRAQREAAEQAARQAAQAAAQARARREAARGTWDAAPNYSDPFEPAGRWWEETTYGQRQETQWRASSPRYQAPPRQQTGAQQNTYHQESRQTAQPHTAKATAAPAKSSPLRDFLYAVILLVALLLYAGFVLDAYRGGSVADWLGLAVLTCPFWLAVLAVACMVDFVFG